MIPRAVRIMWTAARSPHSLDKQKVLIEARSGSKVCQKIIRSNEAYRFFLQSAGVGVKKQARHQHPLLYNVWDKTNCSWQKLARKTCVGVAQVSPSTIIIRTYYSASQLLIIIPKSQTWDTCQADIETARKAALWRPRPQPTQMLSIGRGARILKRDWWRRQEGAATTLAWSSASETFTTATVVKLWTLGQVAQWVNWRSWYRTRSIPDLLPTSSGWFFGASSARSHSSLGMSCEGWESSCCNIRRDGTANALAKYDTCMATWFCSTFIYISVKICLVALSCSMFHVKCLSNFKPINHVISTRPTVSKIHKVVARNSPSRMD